MSKSMAIAYGMKKRDANKKENYADGGKVKGTMNSAMGSPFGEASEEEMAASEKAIPMPGDEEKAATVERIMKKRKAENQNYSEGGMVANDTINDEGSIDQYDDLVLRDDLEGEQPADSNEHVGPSKEGERRSEVVARIMASRSKKDRLPNPR